MLSSFYPNQLIDSRLAQGGREVPVQFDSHEEQVMWNLECNRQIEKGANVTDAIGSADTYLNAWKSRSKALMEARAARNKTYEENS